MLVNEDNGHARLLYRRVLIDAEGQERGIWWIDAIPGNRLRLCRQEDGCVVCERPEPLTGEHLKRQLDFLNMEAMRWCAEHRDSAPVSDPIRNLSECLHEAEAELAHHHRISPSPTLAASRTAGHS